MNEEDLKNIAQQLSKPDGEAGIQMGEMMNSTNITMTSDSINQLNLKDNDSVLEIGHGNCGHLGYLLSKANHLNYTGLEISALMSDEAKKMNKHLLDDNVTFQLYEGTKLPFEESSFDAVFTVNTIYFWKDPQEFLKEIHRVLNQKGKLLITMADKSFMEKLPFTKYVFTLYETSEIEKLAESAGFEISKIKENTDEVRSKAGDLVTRKFYTFILDKV
ncbi:ubiquinone/menaquinone biosynthesis C-methylase UbiE [Flavobacterium arsenatis]|uniref:Ubiquinone/menaquinone biosynthesis C-methylase UbiE n=1 Tax=Flavobacterium arsenatis TaxID=1484332 RepID=A0ABU1TQ28_9FLAO|nr:class I SAM-dependent methyltransferase [Flavobacterium arsenatis]MDR6968070.1 ubiquinone/menaquinone biosynthesis C-methylase UbiE [Flavobacterium arsenatis]